MNKNLRQYIIENLLLNFALIIPFFINIILFLEYSIIINSFILCFIIYLIFFIFFKLLKKQKKWYNSFKIHKDIDFIIYLASYFFMVYCFYKMYLTKDIIYAIISFVIFFIYINFYSYIYYKRIIESYK